MLPFETAACLAIMVLSLTFYRFALKYSEWSELFQIANDHLVLSNTNTNNSKLFERLRGKPLACVYLLFMFCYVSCASWKVYQEEDCEKVKPTRINCFNRYFNIKFVWNILVKFRVNFQDNRGKILCGVLLPWYPGAIFKLVVVKRLIVIYQCVVGFIYSPILIILGITYNVGDVILAKVEVLKTMFDQVCWNEDSDKQLQDFKHYISYHNSILRWFVNILFLDDFHNETSFS